MISLGNHDGRKVKEEVITLKDSISIAGQSAKRNCS